MCSRCTAAMSKSFWFRHHPLYTVVTISLSFPLFHSFWLSVYIHCCRYMRERFQNLFALTISSHFTCWFSVLNVSEFCNQTRCFLHFSCFWAVTFAWNIESIPSKYAEHKPKCQCSTTMTRSKPLYSGAQYCLLLLEQCLFYTLYYSSTFHAPASRWYNDDSKEGWQRERESEKARDIGKLVI